MIQRFFLLSFVLLSSSLFAQQVNHHEQICFPEKVPAGGYSGVCWLGGDEYAVVSDNTKKDGFFLFTITIDEKGAITDVKNKGFKGNSQPGRDNEGIAYNSHSKKLFISGEKGNQVKEYTMDGQLTGRKFNLPAPFAKATRTYGLEALTYNAVTHRYWTTTESTLREDGKQASAVNGVKNLLRLQSFNEKLQPVQQFLYEMDAPTAEFAALRYAFGVSALTALDDGRLLVLEREFYVPESKIGAYVNCKIYEVTPERSRAIAANGPLKGKKPLDKRLLTEWTTSVGLLDFSLANYEGMCLGPRLADGSQVLVLVADSQNQYAGILSDWFKTIVIK